MKNAEAKSKFLQAWGNLGTSWGLNKTMAKVYALLLITKEPMSVEAIREELHISTGNASTNLRGLIDWGLVDRVDVPGERKEFFTCEKDIWAMARQVAKERKKREIDPLVKVLKEVKHLSDIETENDKEFQKAVSALEGTLTVANKILDTFIASEANWILRLASNVVDKK